MQKPERLTENLAELTDVYRPQDGREVRPWERLKAICVNASSFATTRDMALKQSYLDELKEHLREVAQHQQRKAFKEDIDVLINALQEMRDAAQR